MNPEFRTPKRPTNSLALFHGQHLPDADFGIRVLDLLRISEFGFRILALAILLLLVPTAYPQRVPRVGFVYPAGAQQGTTLQVRIGGQYLDGVTNAFFTGGGIQARVVDYLKPLNGRQVNLLRDRLRNLQAGLAAARPGAATISVRSELNTNVVQQLTREAAQKELADIRKKLANPNNVRPANPQIAEIVTLEIKVAPDAAPGRREVRLKTAAGLTAPFAFHVGTAPELLEREPNQKTPDLVSTASLPLVINGQILPGDVDRFQLHLRQGMKLVVAARAREILPYLADAVPGWFQATLALYDAKGKELAYTDDFRFNPDPVLYYEIPAEGDYVLEIKDAIYRGREDFVYRLTVGELPFITSIFPLGGPAGAATSVELTGWNLATNRLTVEPPAKDTGVRGINLPGAQGAVNDAPFAVDTLPEGLEQEPNHAPANSQLVSLPIIINGRIGQPGDEDVFRFQGNAGETIVAEVMARRLNSPLDSALKLTDAAGKQLAFNDDCVDKGSGLNTHHADSYLTATLPATGTYYVHLRDAQQKGGREYAYRLRLSAPRPDFELRVAPSSLAARGGASGPLTVYVLRRDGFTNEIELALKGAPRGFTLSGGHLNATQEQARVTLNVPFLPQPEPYVLAIEGRAAVQGRAVVRPAVPAEDMMQAFAYRHLVPSQDLEVAVVGRGGLFAKGTGKNAGKNQPGKKAKPKSP